MIKTKTIHVKSSFLPVTENVTRKEATGETKKSFFGGDKPVMKNVTKSEIVDESFNEIDSMKLADDVADAIENLAVDGYRVVSTTPISSGRYHHDHELINGTNGTGGFGFGLGFSYTTAIIIIATKETI